MRATLRPVLAILSLLALPAPTAQAQEPGPQLVLHGVQQTSLGVPVFVPAGAELFADGFESGGVGAWTSALSRSRCPQSPHPFA